MNTETRLDPIHANDAAIAAANLAVKPLILAALAPELAARRAALLSSLAAVELAAKNRKTLTDAQLDAAIDAAIEAAREARVGGLIKSNFDDGTTEIGGFRLQGSFHKPNPGGGRSEWVYLPFASQALDEVLAAIRHKIQTEAEYERFRNALGALGGNRQYRNAAVTREKQTAERATLAIPEGTYSVGEAVQVHAMGHWYNGEVVKLGKTGKATVRYTSGTGTTREKAVASDKIRKLRT